jgi:glycosyltransferase involved in cell wall biosynthesis
MIEITTIIPTIGRESLNRAIQSALVQKHIKNHIIVVDDSTCQSLNFSNVTIIRTGGNRGVAFARNLGIRAAKSEWIAFLDDDDQWLPNKSILQVEYMKLKNLDLSLTCAFMSNQKLIRPKKIYKGRIDPLEEIYSDFYPFRRDYYLPFPSVMISGRAAKNLSFDQTLNEREDLWYLHQAYQLNYKIEQLSKPLVIINFDPKRSIKRPAIQDDFHWINLLTGLSKLLGLKFAIKVALRNRILSLDIVGVYRLLIKIIVVIIG